MVRLYDRRLFIGGMLSTMPDFCFSKSSAASRQATGARRIMFIVLRGGWDGLGVVMPVADPEYSRLRAGLSVREATSEAPVQLDSMFALNPALIAGGSMYRSGELLAVHAVATPYRARSHFDGQQVLESGGASPYVLKDGFLNRVLPLIGDGRPAVAVAPNLPLLLRGNATATSRAPSTLPRASDDLKARISQMYEHDARLHSLWSTALDVESMTDPDRAGRASPQQLAKMAAAFMAGPAGVPVTMVEHSGWDTHSQQTSRLAVQLRQLDAMLSEVRLGMGNQWKETLVIVISEFGRTAMANGTGGTDHGTGGLMLLAGGAVKGGRVVADWPGLRSGQLFEERDLRPTTDMRNVLVGAISEHFHIDPVQAGQAMFPGARLQPVGQLIR